MHSVFDPRSRSELLARLSRLQPGGSPRWGRFTGPQMLAHVNDVFRMALGEIPTRSLGLPTRYPPLRQLFVYWLPWGRRVAAPPEMLARVDYAQWDREQADFPRLLERFAARAGQTDWPEHPYFGQLSARGWGVLGYRHTSHHFRQFGV